MLGSNKRFIFRLRYLVIGVVMMAFISTIASSLWGVYQISKNILIENTLETNRVYAQKLAITANTYLEETFKTLEFSALYISENYGNEALLQQEVERLRYQTDVFNSVAITDDEGVVLAISPPTLELKGVQLSSEQTGKALEKKQPDISKPYEGVTGRKLIFISHPIFNAAGEYIGLVGGTIYIEYDNIFHKLLGEHFYHDGSYVYVVDEDGTVIYHQDPSRIGDDVVGNHVVKQLMEGKSGAAQVKNTKGVEMLAGYSSVELSKWGIVSQRPLDVTLVPSADLVKKVAMISMPFVILAFVIVLVIASFITKPLQQMALLSMNEQEKIKIEELHKVNSWYFEARILKESLVHAFTLLQNRINHYQTQSSTDALTGLMNRRTMDETLARWTEENQEYAVVLVDLDHFKSVNDTYGHGVGDEVLKYLAKSMQMHSRPQDICCRYGGEEFIILLPKTNEAEAYAVAENLRRYLQDTDSPCGRPVTMSGGIAAYPEAGDSPHVIIERADQALYKAKHQGRNQVQLSSAIIITQ